MSAMRSAVDSLLVDEFRHAGLELGQQRVLYHYTNNVGLQGILASNVIRASSYRYVNDASEVRFGRRVVSGVIDSLLPDVRCSAELAEIRESLEDGWRDVLDGEVRDG